MVFLCFIYITAICIGVVHLATALMKMAGYCEQTPEQLQVCIGDILSSTAGRLLMLCSCFFFFLKGKEVCRQEVSW